MPRAAQGMPYAGALLNGLPRYIRFLDASSAVGMIGPSSEGAIMAPARKVVSPVRIHLPPIDHSDHSSAPSEADRAEMKGSRFAASQ